MRQGVQAPYRPVKIRAPASRIYPCRFLLSSRDKARVVKLVDTTDLKSVAPDTGVPVRFRFRAPEFQSSINWLGFFFFLILLLTLKRTVSILCPNLPRHSSDCPMHANASADVRTTGGHSAPPSPCSPNRPSLSAPQQVRRSVSASLPMCAGNRASENRLYRHQSVPFPKSCGSVW